MSETHAGDGTSPLPRTNCSSSWKEGKPGETACPRGKGLLGIAEEQKERTPLYAGADIANCKIHLINRFVNCIKSPKAAVSQKNHL